MDFVKGKGKKGLITKTWERCKSFGGGGSGGKSSGGEGCDSGGGKNSRLKQAFRKKSKSWPRLDAKNGSQRLYIAPQGCFSVYVGPQRQRFAIKTEYANHPLFKTLLEEAEFEYGYKSEGPLQLPCNVDDFVKVLEAMDQTDEIIEHQGCTFGTRGHRYRSYHHLNPCKIIAMNVL